MKFERTRFSGLVLVHSERSADERGHFARLFCEDEFAREGLQMRFPQTSVSFNLKAGTIRGMHFQRSPHAEIKLIRCSRGAIFDVLVDLRPEEPTFCHWQGFELSAENNLAVYVPRGFAHGFQTLIDESEVTYAITPSFVSGFGGGVRWDDPAIDILWPLPVSVISERDNAWPRIENNRS